MAASTSSGTREAFIVAHAEATVHSHPGMDPRLSDLARARCISLTTRRRDGSLASPPVWVASDDGRRLLERFGNSGRNTIAIEIR